MKIDTREIAEIAAAQPVVPRVDLYAGIHKALRAFMTDTLLGLGVEVSVHGQTHAVVHHDIPTVDNVSYLIGGRLLHPGDALLVPEVPVEILALPAMAPWMAVKEAIDYNRAVGAAHAFPIHTAVASQAGLALYLRLLEGMGPADCTFHDPGPGRPLSL